MTIIDRRQNPKGKSLANRQRFLRRAREQVKEGIKKSIQENNIENLTTKGGDIKISPKDLQEPVFGHGSGGVKDYVHPGNHEHLEGDHIQKPNNKEGSGREGSEDGEGQDDFSFTISRDEFLDFFFEDLELPELVKKSLKEIHKKKMKRTGFSNSGNPTNIDVVETLKNSMSRRIALKRPKPAEIQKLEAEIAATKNKKIQIELIEKLKKLNGRRAAIPWIDPVDIKYRRFSPKPEPTVQAVMFCLMDVSASMGEREKDIAKRFFILLHLFLIRKYEKVELVFIRHTHVAEEVDQDRFFNDRETGGTTVSTALQLMYDIVKERYPVNEWNIYCAQASDGEDMSGDHHKCKEIIEDNLLPICQFMVYIEITAESGFGSSAAGDLWHSYTDIQRSHKNFSIQKIGSNKQIYSVFKKFFEKPQA